VQSRREERKEKRTGLAGFTFPSGSLRNERIEGKDWIPAFAGMTKFGRRLC